MKTVIVLVALSLLAVGLAASPANALPQCTPTPVQKVCQNGLDTITIPPGNICVYLKGQVTTSCLP